ncbi:hypothetical protein A3A93_01280 [Candidatus Roizmanbacteria bacterium RIFCSPLOWO2_01_FULL_38_12]|uniref:Uncharacterized protein n=1 Tax=Candidatus Roizmanbacteria bacterium RIFCSPLOWO2_01_FULL_38_12 TaxID=1802061 RepID=A0A1F7IR37_9BACT|nr:MAG: hypothetical protein A3F59_03090 [Candidatus Roizmanbacteria bacterium RIFCSPHIGHO2_12_FULL_38_13]OGK45829.1 MAG: hypothetical protein A3A93_01280 [Candidatus Roizmanbacteria bacterium RIFCSPLOWO2_01_FULL_38_12]
MKKVNLYRVLLIVIIIVLLNFGYKFLKSKFYNNQGQSIQNQTNQKSTGANYGDLNTDKQRIADIAINELLTTDDRIKPQMITVKSFEKRTYTDIELGCPTVYISLAPIKPGYRVVLELDGKEYDYRMTEDKILLCGR